MIFLLPPSCFCPPCSCLSDFHVQNQAANGLECFSCVDGDSSATGCSSKSVAKVQCTGIHTMCLEGIGRSRKGGCENHRVEWPSQFQKGAKKWD